MNYYNEFDPRAAAWHLCKDGKARRIPADAESLFQRIFNGLPEDMEPLWFASHGFPLAPKIEGRVGLLKGYGNAINPWVAAEFIRAFMDTLRGDKP